MHAPTEPAHRAVHAMREAGVYVFDVSDTPWQSVGKGGLAQKIVRRDDRTGHSFGFMSFDTLTRTGVHQHLGTAFSYFLSGSLTDFQGTTGAGQLGVNFAGSTHDAIAYQPTLTVGRMEGPVAYGADVTHTLHAGNRHTDFENEFPEHLPDLSITLEAVQASGTRVAGLTRRLVYDYAHTRVNRRMTHLMLLPRTKVPVHRLGALVDMYVLAGDVTFASRGTTSSAKTGDFVVLEPQTQVSYTSRFGASVLVWADGPSMWEEGPISPELYGFTSAHGDPLRFANRAPVDFDPA
ncbi:cupin domain-containing protein [Paraburkholderia sp.]|uniref:cupin domain-containing protein n=1 Tax=Paraburkholderia sp. TaxID=1926495 RepID=UPI0039E5F500